MNYKFVTKVLGFLIIGLSGTMLIPAAIAYYYHESDLRGFIISIIITFITGIFMARFKPTHEKLRIKSSIFLVVFSWVLYTAFGALPYYFCDVLSVTDAVFETMSGFTTTGATVILDIEVLSRSILFWRAFTQWMGGMGIIVLSLAIMPLLGSAGSVLYRAEVPGPSSDKLLPRLQATSKILWMVYCAFTAGLAILLKIFGMNWFEAICHSFTTLSTGGFSTRNASIAGFGSPSIEWIIIVFMFIGGANFSLHYGLFISGNIRAFFKNREFIFYSLLVLLAALGITTELMHNMESPFRTAMFQVVSIITTTGFVTNDYELWTPFAQYILFLLLFVGGCGGSTGGGIKVIRVYVTIKVAMTQIVRLLHPHGVYFIKIGKTTIKEDLIGRVMGFIVLYIIILGAASLLLTFFGHDFITAFSAVATCLGNIGPGFGEVGAIDNYFALHDAAKWILVFCMLAGRLELFTLLVLFSRAFWRK